MGIRNLNTFIKKVCPECITENEIDKYKGKTFAIDCSILIYKYRYVSNVIENAHITGFINRVKFYLTNDILPVFIFDGNPPQAKRNTLLKRNQHKKKIEDKIDVLQKTDTDNSVEQIEIDEEISKLSKQIIYVKKEHIYDCKKILELLGIPYVSAPDEAEKYCAFLQINGLVDYTVTDDTDSLTFGCNNVIKTTVKNKIIETDLNILLKKIEYTQKKFIDFCILSGCDYTPFIPGLAINTVNALFKKYSTIEEVIENTKYNFPEDYNYVEARDIFENFNYEKAEKFKSKNIDFENLKIFLEEKKINNIDKIINIFLKFN